MMGGGAAAAEGPLNALISFDGIDAAFGLVTESTQGPAGWLSLQTCITVTFTITITITCITIAAAMQGIIVVPGLKAWPLAAGHTEPREEASTPSWASTPTTEPEEEPQHPGRITGIYSFVRDVGCQSQCSYTSVRSSDRPRFVPCENYHGQVDVGPTRWQCQPPRGDVCARTAMSADGRLRTEYVIKAPPPAAGP